MLLAGCNLFPTTRKLPIPKPPVVTQTVTPEALVGQLNQRWDGLDSLTAKVEIRASVSNSKAGTAKDYPSIEGHVLMRKPAMLRVLGQTYGVRLFDMAGDGKNFVLSIPHDNKVMKGSYSVAKKSANTFENLRPGFFFDAMMVRGLSSDDEYMVTADTFTIEDAAKKHLYSIPQYILTVMRPKPGSPKKTPVRVVYFHRDDLQPYQQDIYDADGNLATQVYYQAYQDFDSGRYPSSITIKRLPEEITVVLTIEEVHINQTLKDDQFVVTPPNGAVIQNVE
jgi:hypothetical protein